MSTTTSSPYIPVRDDWLARRTETILEPALPIVDPHHHLWERPGWRYMLDDLLADTNSGHNIVGTVFVQCRSMHRASGPVEFRPVGETEAAALLSASAWADAKAAYQKALLYRPKSGFPLYGIALSSEKSGDAKSAAAEYATFISAWKNADASLPQLAHARSYIADHKEFAAGN